MNKWTRRSMLGGGAAVAGAAALGYYKLRARPAPVPFGFEPSPDLLERARQILAIHPSWDAHAHPGRSFARGASNIQPALQVYKAQSGFESRTISDMLAGGLTGACFATVSDFNVLALSRETGLYAHRPFEPGEAWASFKLQLRNMKRLSERGLVIDVVNDSLPTNSPVRSLPRAIWTVEGGDFLEGSVEKLREAYADGIRSITPIHYRTNEIGDTMTGEEIHGGLTAVGETLIREMVSLGMVIDLAHMSEAGAFRVLDLSEHPVMVSHTHVSSSHFYHPRFISLDLAKSVADAGGIIGAWPAGIGIYTLDDFADRIIELIDAVGIEHVSLGTDMDANYRPVFNDYSTLPHLVSRLLEKGLNEAEIAAFLGGNFVRVWRRVLGTDT